MTIQRLDPGARLSEAVVHGGLVYLAGHVSDDPDAGVEQQTREILEGIDRHLAAAGTSKSRLLSVSIWLADISTWTPTHPPSPSNDPESTPRARA